MPDSQSFLAVAVIVWRAICCEDLLLGSFLVTEVVLSPRFVLVIFRTCIKIPHLRRFQTVTTGRCRDSTRLCQPCQKQPKGTDAIASFFSRFDPIGEAWEQVPPDMEPDGLGMWDFRDWNFQG